MVWQENISIEISKTNLRHNYIQVKNLAKDRKIIAILKSNAYGHDILQFAKELLNLGVEQLSVYDAKEANYLISNDIKIPILILGYSDSTNFYDFLSYDVEFSIVCSEQIELLEQIHFSKKIKIQLNIETGFNCLGIESEADIIRLANLHNSNIIDIVGAYTQLSFGSDRDTYELQISRFERILSFLEKSNVILQKVHVDNSLSVTYQDLKPYCNYIRVGSLLYGYHNYNSNLFDKIFIKPILKLSCKIIRLRLVKEGEYIGYDNKFKMNRDVLIATVPMGFADGIPRDLSNKGKLLLQNKLCDIVGNICMNHLMINVSDMNGVKVGDEVIYVDNSNLNLISFDTHAKCINSINTSLMSAINPVITRNYV